MFDLVIHILATAVAVTWLLGLALAVLVDSPQFEAEQEKVPANRGSRLDARDATW
jgi:hypothetical protein